jgi:hypothetical protein
MTIEITTVNGVSVVKDTVSIPYTTQIVVQGIGLTTAGFAPVTLAGASPSTRLVQGDGTSVGNWKAAPFTLPASPGVPVQYNVTITNPTNPADKDSVTITVLKATQESKRGAPNLLSGIHRCLSLYPPESNPVASPLYIAASGTVLDPLNSVFCTLTPIDVTGASTGPSQSSPATMNGNAWTVTFVPPPNKPVTVGNPVTPGIAVNPPNLYSGSYLFEATAPNEGSLSIGVEVPAPG